MPSGKGFWDVVAEFGQIGIIGFLALLLFVWSFVHYQAEPGTEITFVLITYTKAESTSSKMIKLVSRVNVAFTKIGLQVDIKDCYAVRFYGRPYIGGASDDPKPSFSGSIEDLTFRQYVAADRIQILNDSDGSQIKYTLHTGSIKYAHEGIAALLDLKQLCREAVPD